MPLLFHKRIVAVTIKPLLVSWNSLIGWRGLSRLVKWEVGYMIITPTANFVISGHIEHVGRWRTFKTFFPPACNLLLKEHLCVHVPEVY